MNVSEVQYTSSAQLTGFQSGERPLPGDEESIRTLFLLLTHIEVDFEFLGGHARSGNLQTLSVAIALVLAVHVDVSGETGGDVAVARDVDVEWEVGFWDGDEGLDAAVCVAMAILLEFGAACAQLEGCGDLLECRHAAVVGECSRNAARRRRRVDKCGGSGLCLLGTSGLRCSGRRRIIGR